MPQTKIVTPINPPITKGYLRPYLLFVLSDNKPAVGATTIDTRAPYAYKDPSVPPALLLADGHSSAGVIGAEAFGPAGYAPG